MDSDTTADAAPIETEQKGGHDAAGEFVEIIKTIVYALLIALVLRVLLFQPFTIPSGSMIPNLLIGDYIIVSKYSYGYSKHSIPFSPALFKGRILERTPHRGDVVVFKTPKDNRTDYVKRLMGLPGDRIQVRNGVVYINGKMLTQKDLGLDTERGVERIQETNPEGKVYVTQDMGERDTDNTDVFTVPEHMYFMMGDNRDNSLDSRVSPFAGGVGFVPAENLVGKAQIVLFSWDDGASIFKPWTWFTKARWSRFFHGVK
jgi:signal peptidase I